MSFRPCPLSPPLSSICVSGPACWRCSLPTSCGASVLRSELLACLIVRRTQRRRNPICRLVLARSGPASLASPWRLLAVERCSESWWRARLQSRMVDSNHGTRERLSSGTGFRGCWCAWSCRPVAPSPARPHHHHRCTWVQLCLIREVAATRP